MTDQEKAIADYRCLLTQTEQTSQADFDKAVLTLSGGALGLSFAFTKDIVGTAPIAHIGYLLLAWIAWALSSTSILVSFFASARAQRKAIKQLDRGLLPPRPGGLWDITTDTLNVLGLLLFLFGLTMMIFFLRHNLKLK